MRSPLSFSLIENCRLRSTNLPFSRKKEEEKVGKFLPPLPLPLYEEEERRKRNEGEKRTLLALRVN